MINAHLDNSDIGVMAELQQCQRNSEMIVPVALAHLNLEPSPEYRSNHFLRGGLSIAATDSHNRN